MSSIEFEAGRKAAAEGKPATANPFICGTTKLGSPKFSDFEAGNEWQNGFNSVRTRVCTKQEIEAAATVDVSRFRKRRSY